MKQTFLISAIAVFGAVEVNASVTTLDRMPAALETQYALSALPPAMRDKATVYVLDPQSGYQVARQGTSGVACLVERTAWEQADFRNDIYVPLCYDAAGAKTYLQVIMDTAALRIQGMDPAALKTEIEKRYKEKTYTVPARPGISYMIAPVMRTWMLPDFQVHTMPMQHLMFYAPNLKDQDIGAGPTPVPAYPFVFKEGIAEQTYIIQFLGETERAKIMTDEKPLLDALCGYRDVLCVSDKHH